MSPEGRARARSLAERIWVRAPGRDRSPSASAVEEALRERVVVLLDYVDREGRRTRRRPVEPLALAMDRGHWYLLAWCRRSDAGRWFRLDRIITAHPTTERAPGRDLVAVFGQPPADAAPLDL